MVLICANDPPPGGFLFFAPSILPSAVRDGTRRFQHLPEARMPRYATIITADDGAEIVSAIGEFESASLQQRSGRVEQVAPGVRIGMVRGGTVDAVAGFGFPRQGLGPSAVRTVTAKLKAAEAATEARPTKQAGAKPRRKPARKVRKPKAAKAVPSQAATHG